MVHSPPNRQLLVISSVVELRASSIVSDVSLLLLSRHFATYLTELLSCHTKLTVEKPEECTISTDQVDNVLFSH